MKFFNTAGPVKEKNHYRLDPLSRFDLDELMLLINQEKYFVLHAPRNQSCVAEPKQVRLRSWLHWLNGLKQGGNGSRFG